MASHPGRQDNHVPRSGEQLHMSNREIMQGSITTSSPLLKAVLIGFTSVGKYAYCLLCIGADMKILIKFCKFLIVFCTLLPQSCVNFHSKVRKLLNSPEKSEHIYSNTGLHRSREDDGWPRRGVSSARRHCWQFESHVQCYFQWSMSLFPREYDSVGIYIWLLWLCSSLLRTSWWNTWNKASRIHKFHVGILSSQKQRSRVFHDVHQINGNSPEFSRCHHARSYSLQISLHNDLLDGLNSQASHTQEGITHSRGRLTEVLTRHNNCGLWCLIIILIVALVALLNIITWSIFVSKLAVFCSSHLNITTPVSRQETADNTSKTITTEYVHFTTSGNRLPWGRAIIAV